MAVKARGQIGLTDVSDAYGVSLSTAAFTFQGDTTKVKSTQTFTTVVSALQGPNAVPCAVNVSDISLPTGLTVTSDNNATSPTLTFTATTSLTAAILTSFGGAVIIPVSVDNGTVTINKAVAIAISLTGAGGTSAYSAWVGKQVQAIFCDENGDVDGAQTITIPFTVWQGTSRKACTIAYSTLPDGITLHANGNTAGTTSAEGSLILDVADDSDLGGNDTGEITFTVKVGSTTVGTSKFVWIKQKTGVTGTNGVNSATVNLYQRAASSPSKPSGELTYTFATGVLSGTLGSWSQAVPSGSEQLWMITATAIADTATDSIAASEWVGPVQLVKDGTNGNPGTNGYNQATVYLYQRNSSAPNKPSAAVTYTFSTGTLNTVPSGWSRNVPAANGNPCWVTSAPAISQDSSVSIAAASWADVTKLVEDGVDGEDSIVVVIVPSAGTVFKNNNGTNVLTAHVYKGGVEVTGTDLTNLGTIKWYKGDTYLTGKDGTSLTVTATDVTDSETFEARLEA